MNKTVLSFILFASVSTCPVAFGADVPYLTGRVTDNAQILSEITLTTLGEKLKGHELITTNQIVVLTISSLEGESIEDFANKVFNEWKLGQRNKDNGVLIVVVPDERKMRIEVGYGLEGILPDITAGRIIRNIMAPRFREGDFDGGITEGVNSVISVLEGSSVEDSGLTGEITGESEPSAFCGFGVPGSVHHRTDTHRGLYLWYNRIIHNYWYSHTRIRLVHVSVPDTVLGDISDSGTGDKGGPGLLYNLSYYISGCQIVLKKYPLV